MPQPFRLTRRRSLVATVSALALGAASAAALAVTLDASAASAVTGQTCPGAGCPTVSGPHTIGQVESTTDGSFGGATTYTYRWQRCTSSTLTGSCNDIAGATNAEYVLAPPDVNATEYLRVVVTGHDASSAADEASAIVGPIQPAYNAGALPAGGGGDLPPNVTDSSSSAGDFAARVGDSLSSTTASWSSPSGVTTSYQWTRCNAGGTACVPITNVAATATPTAYVLTAADLGATIRMRARGTNTVGTSEQYSSWVGPVEPKAGSPSPTPSGGPGDHRAPQTRFTSKPATTVKTTSANVSVRFAFAADERAHFQCKLDKGPFKACKSPVKLLVAASRAGTKHTFKVRAIDTAGNVDPTPSSFTFTAKRTVATLARTG